MLSPAEVPAPWLAWFAATAVMAAACAMQAAVGIGMALFAVPLLVLIDPQFVPGPMLLAGVLVPLSAAWREWHAVDTQSIAPALLGLAAGTLVGALALSVLNPAYLGKVFGALVLLAVAISLSGIRLNPTRPALIAGSGAAGIMGTMVGIHGPPVALVFQNAQPAVARAMMGTIFVLGRPHLGCRARRLRAVRHFRAAPDRVLLPGTVAGILAAPLLMRRVNARRLRIAYWRFPRPARCSCCLNRPAAPREMTRGMQVCQSCSTLSRRHDRAARNSTGDAAMLRLACYAAVVFAIYWVGLP